MSDPVTITLILCATIVVINVLNKFRGRKP
jgi:hypothetical protein